MGFGNVGLRCTKTDNYRDVFFQSDCDAAVRRICAELGWEKELEAALARAQAIEPAAAWESLVAADEAAREVVAAAEPEPEPEPAASRPSVHQLRQVDSVIAEAVAQVSHQLPLPFAMRTDSVAGTGRGRNLRLRKGSRSLALCRSRAQRGSMPGARLECKALCTACV